MDKYILISVSDKTNLVEFAKEIRKLEYKILATGGTAKALIDAGIDTIEISSFTGFPEILNGRVKTLNPKIFGGILFKRDDELHIKQSAENDICAIDIVCVNLYPFEKYAANPDSTKDELIENIDIGGPSLIRAAAKNYKFVSVLTNPEQYGLFLDEIKKGKVSEKTREKLAVEAFAYTSAYDTLIANKLEQTFDIPSKDFRLNLKKSIDLRYGENPHQKAELYGDFLNYFDFLHGKELSYNNILDVTSAVELIDELEPFSSVIVKHNNPCGVATSSSSLEAYKNALSCDPVAAYGGIVAFNNSVEEDLALKLNEIFLEVVIAPGYSEKAIEILRKKKDRRILVQKKSLSEIKYTYKSIPGGVLKQENDKIKNDFNNVKIVTKKVPDNKQLDDLKFAWIVAKNAKSNTIVFAKNKSTLGIGAGQVSRVDAVKVAIMKAKEFNIDLNASVVASDAYFPFADGLLEAVKYGATAFIQPGGSIRDNEVIESADKNGVTMLFTGIRHFKH